MRAHDRLRPARSPLLTAVGTALPLLVASCSSPPIFERLPAQADAERIVWRDEYGETRAPPSVDWIRHLDCSCDASGGCTGYTRGGGDCYGGMYFEASYAEVALPSGYPLSSTAYAHELWHAKLYFSTGDLDPDHHDAGFQPGGAVDRATAALRAKGL